MPKTKSDSQVKPLTPEEEAAWRALGRAVLVIPRVLDNDLLQTQGLNVTEYSVLFNLSEAPNRSLRMGDLANYVSITVSGLTRVFDRLARQGLVERVRDENDGRGHARCSRWRPASVSTAIVPTWRAFDATSWTTSQTSTSSPSPRRWRPSLAQTSARQSDEHRSQRSDHMK
jgi:DNA-binding MarR family transcriptional regulator